MKYNSEINISTPIYQKKFNLSGKEINALVEMIEFRIQNMNDYLDTTQLIREEWTECLFDLEVLGNLLDWINESGIKANTGKKQAE
jgi:uncharacterized tellurite resistance protein B-like protein